MGNAKIWYRPEGSAIAVGIDLGRRLRSRPGPFVQYRSATSEALGGFTDTNIHSGRMESPIGLTWERQGNTGLDAGSVLWRKLWGLQAHLKRGGWCTYTEDTDNTWAAFLSRHPEQLATQVSYHNPVITNSIAPDKSPEGREVYLHTDPDVYLTEMKLVSNFDASVYVVTLDQRLGENYDDARWVLLREAGTYPVMRVPLPMRSQNFLNNDRNRIFRLDLPLEEDPEQLETLAASGGELSDETPIPQGIDPPDLNPWDNPLGERYRF